MLRFIYGKPALLFGRTLAVADLHIGVERELATKGVRLGSMAGALLKDVGALLEETKAERLAIVGDVKHTIMGAEFAEWLELKAMMRELCGMAKVVIVPGNHDADIGRASGDAEVAQSSGVKIGAVALCHGHAWPDENIMGAEELLIGHIHPCVEVRDELGGRIIERAWLLARADAKTLRARYPKANGRMRIVVMPAFNPLVGGMPLNRPGENRLMGPMLRGGMFKLGSGEIYLLNGVGLGKLSALRQAKV